MKVDVLRADLAAARRERDEAIEDRKRVEADMQLLADQMIYNGNSISWIHSKSEKYGAALLEAWAALGETGVKCDGNTTVADAIRKRGAVISELIAAGKELHEAQVYYDKVDAPGSHRWDRLCAARARHAIALAKVQP